MMFLSEDVDITETEVESYIEQYMEQDSDMMANFARYEMLIFAVVIALVGAFLIYKYVSKKKADKALNEELSAYYDEYMENNPDMSFEDFLFCKAHHINTSKKKKKQTEEQIKEPDENNYDE